MPTGTIARLLIDKGFGFIRDEGGIEHFFHRSAVRGAVFELLREGQRVEAGQALGLLEAMKMEIRFDAPISGTIVEVCARRGQQVKAGEVLIVIDPQSEGGSDKNDAQGALRLPDERDPLAHGFQLA